MLEKGDLDNKSDESKRVAFVDETKPELKKSTSFGNFGPSSTGRKLRYSGIGFHIPRLKQKEPLNLKDVHWREKLLHAMESRTVHALVIFALIIDLILVISSIAFEIEILERELHSCEEELHGGHPGIDPLVEDLEILEEHFVVASITILCLFLVEQFLLFIALQQEYFYNVFHILDVVVVSMSIYLEVTFSNNPEGGLLIIARTWRFARIAHGLIESTHEEYERVLHARLVNKKTPILLCRRKFLENNPILKVSDKSHFHSHDTQHLFTSDLLPESQEDIALQIAKNNPSLVLAMLEICSDYSKFVIHKKESKKTNHPPKNH